MAKALRGLIPPVLTPLDDEGNFDADSLRRHLQRLIEGGVSGAFVLGSMGEGPYLDDATRCKVTETASEVCEGKVPLLAGALEPSTKRVLNLIRKLAQAGAQYAVVTAPFYLVPRPHELERHFLTLADQSPLPLVLYNLPPAHQIFLPVELVAKLSEHENVVALKDSGGDLAVFQNYLETAEGRISLLMGKDQLGLPSLLLGGDGLVVATGNIVPKAWAELIRLAQEGKIEEARSLNRKILTIVRLYQLRCSPVGILKEILRQIGIFSTSKTCPPNSEAGDEERNEVAKIIEELRSEKLL